jgi:hypothetical protein
MKCLASRADPSGERVNRLQEMATRKWLMIETTSLFIIFSNISHLEWKLNNALKRLISQR